MGSLLWILKATPKVTMKLLCFALLVASTSAFDLSKLRLAAPPTEIEYGFCEGSPEPASIDNDPDFPGQEVTRTSEWYDPVENVWVEMGILRNRRTKFALEVLNGTLTAVGGWEGYYTESIEILGPDGAWDWADYSLTQQKAGFGVAHVGELLEDENCIKK